MNLNLEPAKDIREELVGCAIQAWSPGSKLKGIPDDRNS
jgi:hypothetical protein